MIESLGLLITQSTNPFYNLALEQYLTFHVKQGQCILYLWQNQNTVVIGKNQNAWKECRVRALERDGGRMVRRMSGGGAVYHDMGNLNFTFTVRKEDYHVDRQLKVILEAVKILGVRAEKTGRNDITVDGRKISGNAFYESDGFCCHHGTLLLSADKEKMGRYLNASPEKLRSKGIESVRSRVANLSEYCPDVNIRMMEELMEKAFSLVYGLPIKRIAEEGLPEGFLRQEEKKFSSWEWNFGKKSDLQYEIRKRFSWGEIELQYQVDRGILAECRIYSDAMEPGWIESLRDSLTGIPYRAGDIYGALMRLAERNPDRAGQTEDVKALILDGL
ncbi:lipoate--protein ligase [Lacrimispora sp. NSJ-141]|uniref:lipoate--protein ligase n=1 Tax=Lientehia hominis TaxID=2897778 RepID=A0AAP2WAI9_9FIRM|nr:lipoate--protein ligase [Lientehia hominis]MCD2493422.1 lipoate--protein ligase [Lientehia hominis]